MRLSTTAKQSRESRGVRYHIIALVAATILVALLVWKEFDKLSEGFWGESETNKSKCDHQQTCKQKLDALEHIWDLRREGRMAQTFDRTLPVPMYDSPGTFDFYEPEAVCFDDERFGSSSLGRYQAFGDGPKFVCGVDLIVEKANSTKDCLVYSVGSNNEIDFEVAVSETMGKGNCEIHTFDPTIRAEDYIGHNYSTFHEWGFGEDGIRRGSFTEMSLATVMQKLGHYNNRTIDIFKIDCETCEFSALTAAFDAIASGQIKIDQVQVEIHGFGAQKHVFPLVKKLFEAADGANMRIFHKEPNSWGCKGYGCVEYAFASNEFLRRANARYVC